MRLTRRKLLAGGAGAALAAAGIYELVDQLGGSPSRPAAGGLPPEQHLLDGVRIVEDNGVEVVVPPLHHQLVTATVKVATDVKEAQGELEHILQKLEKDFDPTPAGLGSPSPGGCRTSAPTSRSSPTRTSPSTCARRRPRTSRSRCCSTPGGSRATRPRRSSRRTTSPCSSAATASSTSPPPRRRSSRTSTSSAPTSIRRGFAGGGFDGGQSLPKKMAVAANVPGSFLIPDQSELFLGFTSTQKAGLGPPKIANLEELGFSNGGYFSEGTHLAVAHISEDLEAWYVNFPHPERVSTVFRPGLKVKRDVLTVPQGPDDVSSEGKVKRDFERTKQIGHSASLQTVSRLATTAVGASGAIYGPGTAIPHRADFNTLDNPFAWSVDPERDGMADGAAAGVHFVVFNPSSDDFNRGRLAMDGVLPDGTKLPFAPRDRGQGFNSILRTTHRQNFLVPPRRHRSFPLAELL